MTFSEAIRARSLHISESELGVELEDGSRHAVPLSMFPLLAEATAEERAEWEWIGDGIGIHWPQVDEDISVFSIVHPERTQPMSPQSVEKLLEQNRRRRAGA
ncbi:MAG: DUF2442 domain-containing protein [Gemmatimonadota bacterium]